MEWYEEKFEEVWEDSSLRWIDDLCNRTFKYMERARDFYGGNDLQG